MPIDRRTITCTDRGYDIRIFDGPDIAGGDLRLSRKRAIEFLRDECGMTAETAEYEVYSADQIKDQPREFWV
jgi:hypothetical protein